MVQIILDKSLSKECKLYQIWTNCAPEQPKVTIFRIPSARLSSAESGSYVMRTCICLAFKLKAFEAIVVIKCIDFISHS